MAHIDNLVSDIPDPDLRRQMAAAVKDLKARTKFGLHFEQHLPERTILPDLTVTVGANVVKKQEIRAGRRFRVESIQGETATLCPEQGGEPQTAPLSDLRVVKSFNEPIYPTLTEVDRVERGDDKPFHTLISAENFHAVQLLVYLYEGQVDCLYLDPPYNTGAKDWTYNNQYVDKTDAYRHSKWLSFMEKRLKLAKRLLKPDGVLIITIDEHEVHHLGMLLEDAFPEMHRQMVTIVINQKGVAQGRLSRAEEYAFFCYGQDFSSHPHHDDLLAPDRGEEKRFQTPRWEWLLRGGADSNRSDRYDMFYPIQVDPVKRSITSIGDPLPRDESPDLSNLADREVAWPIRTDNSLGRWRVSPKKLRDLFAQGYVRLGGFDEARGTWTVLYLGEQAQKQVETGVIKVTGKDAETGAVTVEYAEAQEKTIKTVWHRGSHDAGTYGSSLLRTMLDDGNLFSFPKSLY